MRTLTLLWLTLLLACQPAAPAPPPTPVPPPAAAQPAPAAPAPAAPAPPVVRWYETPDHRYMEALLGGADSEEPLPMLIFIHGLGDRPRPSMVIPMVEKARVILPQAPTPHGGGFAWFPYRVGADNEPGQLGEAIVGAAHGLARSIDTIVKSRPTVGRPIVIGFSQGGMLSFALALHHPELFEAAYPLAGGLPPAGRPPAKRPDTRYPPIHAFHGDSDPIVPMRPTQDLVQALSGQGFPAELRIFRGVRHQVTEPMWEQIGALVSEDLKRVLAARPGQIAPTPSVSAPAGRPNPHRQPGVAAP